MAEFDDDDMDNDNAWGYWCQNRRAYCLWLAFWFLLYGLMNAIYYILVAYVDMFKMEPSHCYGIGCSDVMGCKATRNSSYELRVTIMTIGSVVFGVIGLAAVLQRYANEMFIFFGWVTSVVFVYMLIACLDFAYLYTCDYNYPKNMVYEVALWPIPNWPVSQGIKYEIENLDTKDGGWPYAYTNELFHQHNIAILYFLWTLVRISFFSIMSYQCFVLAERFHYGMAGMGINFSIEGWRKRLMMRYELNEVAYNTFGMACATAADMGWEQDEYMLQRPFRQPHWYRGGMMPAATGRAYDGFSDPRRNVLL